jgi:predicted NAD/FAD-binding protein
MSTKPTVAVIGSGISGLAAAYALRETHQVTLFEADHRFGGHAHTHDVRLSDGTDVAIDSGFIVHNERTYPELLRIFRELEVPTQATEMSMSVTCEGCGLSYVGSRGLRGIFAQPRRLFSARFVRMLTEVPRFHRRARRVLASGDGRQTWGEFLEDGGFSDYFIRHFAVPLVSCVWSSGDQDTRDYPARHLFAFLDHHGLLRLLGAPQWRTVVGGSRVYVEKLLAALGDVRADSAVASVRRTDDGVEITGSDGTVTGFDQAVIATHADDALAMLADASEDERADLAAVGYSENVTYLHRDESVLPEIPAARGSWNYRMGRCDEPAERVLVSYWMNHLHRVDVPDTLSVTLNPGRRVDESTVIAKMTYRHPIFTHEAVAAAARLRGAGGSSLAFAGAHLGWGFHEDGCRSGIEAATRLLAQWEARGRAVVEAGAPAGARW